jgi:hypothetical protein
MTGTTRSLRDLCNQHFNPENAHPIQFVEDMLCLMHGYKFVWASIVWPSMEDPSAPSILFVAGDGELVNVEVPSAVTMLRIMCARLATIASERGRGDFTLYGGSCEFHLDRDDGIGCKLWLRFANTMFHQEFRLGLLEVQAKGDGDC